MTATFQRSVHQYPALAVEGDFASANPRASMLAGDSGLISGPLGVTIGLFAWALNSTGVVTTAKPGGAARSGFVARHQVSLITPYLGSDTMLTVPGLEITLHVKGDFWARFAAGATIGDKVFSDDVTGAVSSHPAGTTVAGSTEQAFFVGSTAAAGELAKISA